MQVAMQRGVPLNDTTFSTMSKEEYEFWIDFLEQAQKVINDKEKKKESMPYKPPKSLREKYLKALAEYNGEQYCQIQQLKEIFAFGEREKEVKQKSRITVNQFLKLKKIKDVIGKERTE